ncbi:glutathione S-transferase family protein [Lichenicoccus sp.]|uniref:glutathione S-transferase family protein n=1 Tax=Lichenicoccus sp. TaxID=2781899 RepID=UPI003D0D16C9
MLLYSISGTCSLAPHILLEYIGAPFEVKLLNRETGENKENAYLAVNPKGRVPALVVDGTVILENVAIQLYLAERFAERSLAPIDLLQRARWMAALTWMSNSVHLNFRQYRRPEYYTPDENARAAVSARGRQDFIRALEDLDDQLKDGQWLLGDEFSTADAYAHVFHLWGLGAKFPIQHLRNLHEHGQAMMAIPATRRAFEREGVLATIFD